MSKQKQPTVSVQWTKLIMILVGLLIGGCLALIII